MDNPYGGAKLPPSLVTVENGFAFPDDSDLSSLNTTPRKQAHKSMLGGDQADLELHQSKANRRLDHATNIPPHEVQVGRQSRGRNREDLKEKYRRMASPSSRRIKPAGGRLNSWKKKADERMVKAQKEVKPWYVPEESNGENGTDNNKNDDEQDVSPIKAKKHTFEEEEEGLNDKAPSFQAKEEPAAGAPEDEQDELLVDKVSSFQPAIIIEEPVKPDAPPPPEEPPAPSIEPMNEVPPQQEEESESQQTTVVKKSTFVVTDRSPSPQVDIYGCPIFRDDDDEPGLEDAKAKLDQLDNEQHEEMDSIKAMLSSASFFSKSAAQTLTDASHQGVKLLGNAAQGVEELVLGPVQEGNEESDDEEDVPPPPPPRRGRSPTAIDNSTNCAARRMNQDDSAVTSSFVLEDKSEVDVHYVLDDLATLESTHANEPTTEETAVRVEQVKEPANVVVEDKATVDESVDTDLFVSVDDAKVDSIDSEIDAVCDAMDTIHVKEEVERLDALHEQKVREAAKVAEDLRREAESSPADEISEEMKNEESDNDEESIAESASDDKAPPTTEATTLVSDAVAEEAEPPLQNEKIETADEIPDSLDDKTASTTSPEESSKVEVATTVDDKDQEDSTTANVVVGAAVIAGAVVGAGAAITVEVTPEKEEEIKLDRGQIIIASPGGEEEETEGDSEFPPTDDADVDKIDFDTISVKSEGTPVRANLDDSKEALKKEAEEKNTVQVEKKANVPEQQETAPVTPKAKAKSVRDKPTKASKNKSKETSKSLSKEISVSPSKEQPASKPAMVKTLDDNNGIAKGDMVLSLLNANLSEANRAPKGGDQVRDAILRMRDMRRRQEKVEMPEYEPDESGGTEFDSPSKRSVLPVDVDDMHVVGAFDHVKTLEEDAIEHLKHDEIEAALELYEEIVSIYAEAFKENAKSKRKKKDKNDHKAYIGAALHNIGILQLLRSDFEEALSFFEKAAENRKDHFGEGSVDHLASLGKIALCHYAMDEYETAHKSLEQVLELSKNHLAGLTDFMQVAEILNNLGCLSFMCGQSGSAMTMFKECLEIQTAVLKQSLYGGPTHAGQSTSLSISVTRGNIGYVQMLTKNAGAAIIEFEASLMHQQMILSDAHDTVICTMDHLAVANLLAKNKEEATKMLGRMLRAQLAAYGATDERCVLTLSKLQLVQTEKTDYLEKALDQLWDQHSSKASPSSKSARVAANKRSTKMLKKLSFRKKAAKLGGSKD